jgi:hypothetical protein
LIALGVVYALLFISILEARLYLPGPVLLTVAVAFALLGLALVWITARQKETGMLRLFLLLTGYSALAMPLAAILHNFILEVVLFILALLILPVIFLFSWFVSFMLIFTSGKSSRVRKIAVFGVPALVVSAVVLLVVMKSSDEGYRVTSELISSPDSKIERIFITAEVEASLIEHFAHALGHSLESAFESNGIEVTLKFVPGGPDALAALESDIAAFSPDGRMHLIVKPLLRDHRSGRQAIVGTLFDATLSTAKTGEELWKASGKVDYIGEAFFRNPAYRADYGIRKEFAWHTTAAIVRSFMRDLHGRESASIHTDSESRERHGQRAD